MQVWNVLYVARWKYGMQKWRKKSPSGHHPTTLSGYIFAIEACIDNRKKPLKQQYILHMSAQYDERRPTSGWDRFGSLGHPSYFQRLPRLGSVTAQRYCTACSSGHQPNFAACNRGRTYVRQGDHHVGHLPTFLIIHLKRSCVVRHSMFMIFEFWSNCKSWLHDLPTAPASLMLSWRIVYCTNVLKTSMYRGRLQQDLWSYKQVCESRRRLVIAEV